jgi:hypothetical protein
LQLKVAERGGFEPPVDFKGLRRFSKPLLSTTQPPLREAVQFFSDRSTSSVVAAGVLGAGTCIRRNQLYAGRRPIYRVDGIAQPHRVEV